MLDLIDLVMCLCVILVLLFYHKKKVLLCFLEVKHTLVHFLPFTLFWFHRSGPCSFPSFRLSRFILSHWTIMDPNCVVLHIKPLMIKCHFIVLTSFYVNLRLSHNTDNGFRFHSWSLHASLQLQWIHSLRHGNVASTLMNHISKSSYPCFKTLNKEKS